MKAGYFNSLERAWTTSGGVGVGSVLWVCHKKMTPDSLELDPDANMYPEKYIAVSRPYRTNESIITGSWVIRASVCLGEMFDDATETSAPRQPREAVILPSLGLPITLDSWQEEVRFDGSRISADSVRGLLEFSCGPDIARSILDSKPEAVADKAFLDEFTA